LSVKHIDKLKLFTLISLVFVINVLSLFFRAPDGKTSFNLINNYYYNSRNNLLIKSELDLVFMNETNLSLLVLTSIILVIIFLKSRWFKIPLTGLLIGILLILASRTAVITLVVVLTVFLFKFVNKKTRKKALILTTLLLSVILSTISVEDIPFINTIVKRTLDRSFGSQATAYGLGERFIHYANAYQNSQELFNIKGYKYLLNKYNFSSHNEILGHSSATGILPSI